MCIFIYTLYIYIHIYIYIYMYIIYLHMHTYIFMYVYIYTHPYMYIYVYMCMFMCISNYENSTDNYFHQYSILSDVESAVLTRTYSCNEDSPCYEIPIEFREDEISNKHIVFYGFDDLFPLSNIGKNCMCINVYKYIYIYIYIYIYVYI
jgi:hypothetical protein